MKILDIKVGDKVIFNNGSHAFVTDRGREWLEFNDSGIHNYTPSGGIGDVKIFDIMKVIPKESI